MGLEHVYRLGTGYCRPYLQRQTRNIHQLKNVASLKGKKPNLNYPQVRLFSDEAPKRWPWGKIIRRSLYVLCLGYLGSRYYVYWKVCAAPKAPEQWQVDMYTKLPLNVMSRLWGRVHELELPTFLREPLYKWYIKTFNVNLEEAAIQNLQYYENLGEFFRRRIDMNLRPIDKKHSMVSPCDGQVLHCGEVEDGWLEQVKGVKYSLPGFMGPSNWPSDKNGYDYSQIQHRDLVNHNYIPEETYEEGVKGKDRRLYHCVLYLAPGDYHGFHSPAEWVCYMRRHFAGSLLSVSPRMAHIIQDLFNQNERALYFGEWEQGFMAVVPVGATNCGSIKVYFDEDIDSNNPLKVPVGSYSDELFIKKGLGGIALKKGEPFGEFNLGSTIVLVFEAPKTFNFTVKQGQTIKIGEPLGCYKKHFNIPR